MSGEVLMNAGEGGVVHVTLRHAGRLNAMSRTMWRQLRSVFEGIQAGSARCVVMAGEGAAARFGAPIAKLGFPMAPREAQLVAAAVGETAARQMLLEAATFTAADMLARGFLSRVVPDDDVPAEALASARRIAALAPGAARMNKQVLRALKTPPALDGKAPAAIEMIVNGPHDPYAYADSAEHREGITAFLAKRPPVFY